MASIKRVLEAVDDAEWQRFRRSLKGISTEDKLKKLWDYYSENAKHIAPSDYEPCGPLGTIDDDACDTCVRVDNYIKALCRGGQLYPGESLWTAFELQFEQGMRIKRN